MLALDALQRAYQAVDQFGDHGSFDDGKSVVARRLRWVNPATVCQHVNWRVAVTTLL